VLHQYEKVIKDTTYNLEVHLQQIDEKLAQYKSQGNHVADANIDLRDERVVTQQCLRICQDASCYIESLAARESSFLRSTPQATQRDNKPGDFEAQVLVREAFNTSQAMLSGVIHSLGERLRSVVVEKRGDNEEDRTRLQEDLNMSKQCLEVCKMAGEVYHQKIHTIGEAIAEDNSDQVVVTTLADLFDVKKALSKGHSAQLVATLTPENFDRVVDKRYSSRFGVSVDHSAPSRVGSTISTGLEHSRDNRQYVPPATNADGQPPSSEARRDKPSPNEVRKRYGDADSGRAPASPRD
jgi:recombinational DNA repair protein RecR